MYDSLTRHQPVNINTKATYAFVMNSLSHRVIDDPYFMDFCKAVAAGDVTNIPSRKVLRTNIIAIGEKVKQVCMHAGE